MLHLHINKDIPDIHTLVVCTNQILKQGTTTLWVAGTELKLSKANDQIAVEITGESLEGALKQFAGGDAVVVGEQEIGVVNPDLGDLGELLDHDFEEIICLLFGS
jgi:hypothetical protein